MHIVMGQQNAQEVESKYTVLELDTLKINNEEQPVTAYCLVENVPLHEIATLTQYHSLHSDLIRNYKIQNWNYCVDALGHLRGRWNRELDSFYDSLQERVLYYQKNNPGTTWDGVVDRTGSTTGL